MSDGWSLKRFWTEVALDPVPGGFSVTLDGRPVRTPAKALLVLPTRALALWVAEEWRAQEDKVRPATMPATRTANTALDTLPRHRAAIVEDLAGYGGTDLLCYRASEPAGLCARQAAAWDPLLDWARLRYGIDLRTGQGVMPVTQDAAARAALAAEVARQDDFRLAAFHDLVALSGSLILALAVAEGIRSPEEAWDLSRIDETWQAEQWGADDEAEAAAHAKRAAFVHAARFHSLCGQANAPSVTSA